LSINYGDSDVVEIISSMFGLIENKGFKPDEVIALLDELKEKNYAEMVEVYNNL